ncbi:MAG: DUF3604 domain-containing protein [Steroidobacteraceae bacterium]
MRKVCALLGATLAAAFVTCAVAQTNTPTVPSNPLKNAYFGDLHLHTGMSFDAFLLFDTHLYAEEAYRFARGEQIELNGRKVSRGQPLDFLGVADHSEYLGQVRLAAQPGGPLANTRFVKVMQGLTTEQRWRLIYKMGAAFGDGGVPDAELLDDTLVKSNWQLQIDAAEKFYEPGRFTTFVAYEWTSNPNGANLHRNVIFKGPKYPQVPFSALDSAAPEALWRYILQQRSQGIDAVVIPHNANVSDGLMWSYADTNHSPMTREYAETRASIERLVEITQHKGTSETRPELSPNDEFAGFELMDNLLTGTRVGSIHGSYVREAYGRGLEIAQRTGVNPFQFGLIGSSDYHTAMSRSSENDTPGAANPAPDVQKVLQDAKSLRGAKVSTGGLAGVWAESNTREAIFDALYRRETFATSGTRPRVRFFSGFNYSAGITKQRDWIKRAYAGGVPMGADLLGSSAAGKQGSPRFLAHAVKDPDGANLDRIQIVKVWIEDDAQKEQVYDVAWSGNRKASADGKVPSVGSSVNTQTATYTNDIGAVELLAEWQDPQFKPDQAAVYYARVLEIPTPRWTTLLAVSNKLPLPTSVPAEIQERAWTSPVFYRP